MPTTLRQADHILTRMPIDLGEHRVLRLARPDDADSLVDFNTRIFDDRVRDWSRDLLCGGHPTVRPDDFTIVEDTRDGKIVSSMCLISHTWAYGGIPLRTGRFELVATDPAYRRLGLIRKQFDVTHARSAAKGELIQVITGVDWFYRQFGYEMGIQLWGSRFAGASDLRTLPDPREDVHLRQAVADDHAFIRDTYEAAIRGRLFAALRSPEEWQYEFTGRSFSNTRRREWLIIEGTDGRRCGYVQYLPCLASPSSPAFRIYQIELTAGASHLNLAGSILRALWLKGLAMVAAGHLTCQELQGLELALERDHPFFRALPSHLNREVRPSPWYVRIPDIVAFVRKVRPALEEHLVGTVAEGYSGELKLNFFRCGMVLNFNRGHITTVEHWSPAGISDGDVRLPESAFVQLVCGWRRFSELGKSFPECWSAHEAALLMDHLFPPSHDKVWVLA
jgi:hypothetical protein